MRIIQLLVCVVIGISASGFGATYYVNAGSTGTGDGLSWENAFPYLQDALAGAVSGDSIQIAGGVYYPDEGTVGVSAVTNNDPAASFVIPAGVSVFGGWLPFESGNEATVLSGDIDQNDTTNAYGVVESDPDTALNGTNSYHVVQLTAGEATMLSGVTVTAGSSSGGSPHNSGGGILINQATATLESCTLSGNYATYDGGGFLHKNGGLLVLTNCVLTANRAGRGGAAAVNYASAVYADCQVSVNFGEKGGGLFSENSDVTIQNGVIEGNESIDGAALFHQGGSARLMAMNTLIVGNIATSHATLWLNNGEGSLINCTVSGNKVMYGTAGLFSIGGQTSTVYNCIFYDNALGGRTDLAASSVSNDVNSASLIAYSLIENSGGSTNWNTDVGVDAGHNLDVDPLFVDGLDPMAAPLTGGDFRVYPQSEAVDAGTNEVNTLATDVYGHLRLIGAKIDMGAAEMNPGQFADLAVAMVVLGDLSLSGNLYYEIIVSNLSDLAVANVVVTNEFSSELDQVFWANTEFEATNSFVVFTLPDVSAYGISVIQLSVQIGSNTVTDVTNFVSVSYSSLVDPDPSNNSTFHVSPMTDFDQDQIMDFVDPDDDNDGMDDVSEQIAGTDQFDAGSRFLIELDNPGPNIWWLNFSSVAGREYLLESTTNLTDNSWQDEGLQSSGDGAMQQFSVNMIGPTRFYRVKINYQPPPP